MTDIICVCIVISTRFSWKCWTAALKQLIWKQQCYLSGILFHLYLNFFWKMTIWAANNRILFIKICGDFKICQTV